MPNLPQTFNKTRIAPTPSGYLHLGNVLSFAITAALARKKGAKISLRIDDLDRARVNQQYVQDIFDTLNFLTIPWDEGPRDIKDFEASYSQLHRMHLYMDTLKHLADEGLVYACNCTRSTLNNRAKCLCFNKKIHLSAENTCWRLLTGDSELEIKSYNDSIIKAALPAEMQNFVVKKKDGFPAYQLTSIIDDLFFGVDLVVRGEDLWPSTLAQIELAARLGKFAFGNIVFYHHPLLMDGGKKLSKSAGATSVHYLRENGQTLANIFTLIAGMLGIDEAVKDWEQLAALITTAMKL